MVVEEATAVEAEGGFEAKETEAEAVKVAVSQIRRMGLISVIQLVGIIRRN